MIFKKHLELEGQHAFLSASQYHWVNYTEEKLKDRYTTIRKAMLGTELHDFAARAIKLNQKMPKNSKTLNMFVNDAIAYAMQPEQILYFSPNCFGTADAISFRKNVLRIHDLKTGTTPASMTQLKIYAVLFCLEYNINIQDINIELRIYQNDLVLIDNPDKEELLNIKNKIITFDSIINDIIQSEV